MSSAADRARISPRRRSPSPFRYNTCFAVFLNASFASLFFLLSLPSWLSFGQRSSVVASAWTRRRRPSRRGARGRPPSAAAKGRRARSSRRAPHRILRPLGGSCGEALASLRRSPPPHGPPPPPPPSPSLAAPPPPPSRGAASGDSQPPSLARGLPRPSAVVVWAGGRAKGREGGPAGGGARWSLGGGGEASAVHHRKAVARVGSWKEETGVWACAEVWPWATDVRAWAAEVRA